MIFRVMFIIILLSSCTLKVEPVRTFEARCDGLPDVRFKAHFLRSADGGGTIATVQTNGSWSEIAKFSSECDVWEVQ